MLTPYWPLQACIFCVEENAILIKTNLPLRLRLLLLFQCSKIPLILFLPFAIRHALVVIIETLLRQWYQRLAFGLASRA